MIRIVFMGTPEFAIPCLEAIKQSGNSLVAIVTQPDKPRGRGNIMTPSPVKEWGIREGIPVFQPVKVRNDYDFMSSIRLLEPDLVVTAAFGQILPQEFLDIPSLGCINVHASLLPKYRGASPIQHALINGEKVTGITIIYMDAGMDTGDIIAARKISIGDDENAGELHDRLACLGGELLLEVIKRFEKGKPEGVPQDHEKATYCGKIDKSMGEIDWDKKAYDIRNMIRGLTPWPGAFTYYSGKRLKVWKAAEREYLTLNQYEPGTVILANERDGLVVRCRDGVLQLLELQGEGGRRMTAEEYLRGNPILEGTRLGQPNREDS